MYIILLIYVKSFKNSLERVNFAGKFQAVGGGTKTIVGCQWSWVVVAKLWLVVDGRE